MPNNNTGAFGLRPTRYLNGSPYNGEVIKCYVSASYATALYVGDPVLMSPTLAEKDSTGKLLTINLSAGTDGVIVRGVIVGFEPNPDNLNRSYLPASTGGYAYVAWAADDLVFQVRGDGGGTPAAVFVGQNAVLKSTGGSTTSGLSGFMLDEGTTTAPAADQSYSLFILGIVDKEDNTLADNALYEVLINTNNNATGRILGVTAS